MSRPSTHRNDVAHEMRRRADHDATGLWGAVRDLFDPEVQQRVDRVAAQGPPSLLDLCHLAMAQYVAVTRELATTAGDHSRNRHHSVLLQVQKHLRQIVIEMGPAVDANTQLVEVPCWLAEPLIRVEATLRVLMGRLGQQLAPEERVALEAALEAAEGIPSGDAGDEMM